MTITSARLRELLTYDPLAGTFRWRINRRGGATAGSIAGYVKLRDGGRRWICIDGRLYPAARLAWLYVHDEWSERDVEHRDTDPSNDRLANLRLATRSQNNGNVPARKRNTSGHKGVHWSKDRQKWVAMIQFEHRHKNLGRFDTLPEAVSAYQRAAIENFGEFARLD